MSKVFALVDCNNFYASCERIFNPSLEKKPIVVLSNNDGCIIARSNEAKDLGILMGAPYYQNKAMLEKNNVVVFSSNYPLYADISHRVMQSLRLFVPEMEVYSIDEAFLRLDCFHPDSLFDMMLNIRKKINQWTGIPTSCGIAPTKTLAKIANHIAKKHTTSGVFNMQDKTIQNKIMSKFPIESLWGIGHGRSKKLNDLSIYTALQLKNANPKWIRQHLGVVLERMIYELNGCPCLDLETTKPKKNIVSSKAFGQPLSTLQPIEEALAHYTAHACEKLRKQGGKAQGICIFLKTNPFKYEQPQYNQSCTLGLNQPTSDTGFIIKHANNMLKSIYKKGFAYHKCGIMLLDITQKQLIQEDLFAQPQCKKTDQLMETLDKLNTKMGSSTVFYGAQGTKQVWKMRATKRSKRFTTQWNELADVY